MSNKQQILEPITSIAKLALLPFRGDGVKIAIFNYGLHYDDPNNQYYIQHVLTRKLRGDNREDISVLNDMIINFLDWYIINNDNPDSQKKLTKLLILSIGGMKKLQETYNDVNSNVIFTLQYYINLIHTILENINKYKNTELFSKLMPDTHKNNINLIDVNSVKKIWIDTEINKLYDEITDCFTNDDRLEKKCDEFIDQKVKGLINILEKKDEYFLETIKKSCGSVNQLH